MGIIMKKHSLTEFLKSKSFYALLCVGTLAILAITMVSTNQSTDKEENRNLVDLNEPNLSDVAEGADFSDLAIDNLSDGNNQLESNVAENEGNIDQTEIAENLPDHVAEVNGPVTDGSLLEFEAVDDPNAVASIEPLEESEATNLASAEETEAASSLEDSREVMKPDTLYFEAETGLLWPVAGNVIMNYSVDQVIYYQTLEQFKINPAVIIDAEVGTKVRSAAKGVITSIEEKDDIGVTVVQSLGNGYSLVYGQLKNVKVEVGDMVEEGDKIGAIASPTKFYTLEGSNLYFQVMKDEKTMNPMLLLR